MVRVDREKEEWRWVVGSDTHQVSNLGRIQSRAQLGGFSGYSRTWRLLKPQLRQHYLGVTVLVGGKQKQAYVHQLVAEAFIGPRPDGLEINHIDGRKQNNSSGNLEYVTRSENGKHSLRIGLRAMIEPLRGEQHPRAKLTQLQADEIRQIYVAEKIGMARLAARYGVTKVVVSNILKGRSYAASPSGRTTEIPRHRRVGQDNPSAAMTNEQADAIRALHKSGQHTMRSLAKQMGVHPSTISQIIAGITYPQ